VSVSIVWVVVAGVLAVLFAVLFLLARRRVQQVVAQGRRAHEDLAHATRMLRKRDGEVETLRTALAGAAPQPAKAAAPEPDNDAKDGTWRAMLDLAPFPVWRRDADLNLAWVNRTYARMAEASAGRVVERGMELAASLAPDQPRKLAERALAAGTLADEMRRFVAEGDRRAYRIFEAPQAGGGTVGYGQDITNLEEARSELQAHIDAHAEVLQSLGTAISIFGPDKRLVLFNRAYAGLWQLDETWLAEQPLYVEVLERLREQRGLPEVIDWSAWRRQQVDQFNNLIEPREELLHLPDGRTFRATVTPHPFGGLLFAHHDVTDQLILERARNTLLAVQRATLDNLFEGVAVFGSDGRLKLFNKALSTLWRLPAEFLASQPHIGDPAEADRGLLGDARL
jgi:PAS domain-containing protein